MEEVGILMAYDPLPSEAQLTDASVFTDPISGQQGMRWRSPIA